MAERLILFARYEPPGWGDPPPCCVNGHDWSFWRAHPNGVDDVRTCRRSYRDGEGRLRSCSFSDWREHRHWWTDELNPAQRRCRMPGCVRG